MNNNEPLNLINALQQVQSFLQNIIVQVTYQNVTVEVSAEPKLLSVQINQNVDKTTLEKNFLEAVNQAFIKTKFEVAKKTIQQFKEETEEK